MNPAAAQKHHRGVIVPMVTPITADGTLDQGAVGRIVDHLIAGRVHGVFVLGTTGEGPAVPQRTRDLLVKLVAERANGHLRVYAGVSEDAVAESATAGNRYFDAGVDAVIAHVPSAYEVRPKESLAYFTELAGRLSGDLILYNMPLTTNVSLPIEVCEESARKAKVVGIKDSENDPRRLGELLRVLGQQQSFSIFVGTGPLMAIGLLQGADGIVPSAGNLVPQLCRRFYDSVIQRDTHGTEALHAQLMAVSNVYQKGRTLGQSVAALKGAMTCLGLCGPDVFAPLTPITEVERLALRIDLLNLGIRLQNAANDAHPLQPVAEARPGAFSGGAA